ncbi:hypothetical protein BEL04_14560 [Mucilaginibacter sp. PPCGB 2223]|uniref:hypothetical protein n=1 Tax=Mucilaginibacter sp. PPCGB 2223 TaxID=1886027 RepID=UPI0008269B22|nr:hypothetical protein [Mucilaginibacter sp. PPCGB 2223]OCX52665.1 hypothetical protein BEL04_14560 [Mucilaginibacter sp. PPCGB 2223]
MIIFLLKFLQDASETVKYKLSQTNETAIRQNLEVESQLLNQQQTKYLSIAMFDLLIQLKNNGTLNHMVRNGLMSPKVFMYLEIYMYIDARVKAGGKSVNSVVLDAEIAFEVSRATVWRSIKIIKGIKGEKQ